MVDVIKEVQERLMKNPADNSGCGKCRGVINYTSDNEKAKRGQKRGGGVLFRKGEKILQHG